MSTFGSNNYSNFRINLAIVASFNRVCFYTNFGQKKLCYLELTVACGLMHLLEFRCKLIKKQQVRQQDAGVQLCATSSSRFQWQHFRR